VSERATTQQKITSPTSTPGHAGLLRRKCACGGAGGLSGKCAECDKHRLSLQRNATDQAASSAAPDIVEEVLRMPGQPLDPETRISMELRFGHDFSQVRIHIDARAAESARAVNALAYTVGKRMVFDSGQFAPHTPDGRKLLAHELTHVMQANDVAVNLPIKVGSSDSAEERTAEHAEYNKPMSSPTVGTLSGNRLYRKTKGGSIGGFFADIGRGLASFFTGKESGYDEKTLLDYLKYLEDNKDIEDDFDSDNKARAVVRRWKAGEARFQLSPKLKILLIKEMQSGFTGDDDEQAILDILENSSNGDLRLILGPSGVSVKDLNEDFNGAEWKQLQSFYTQRFTGGLSALLKGVVEPIGSPKSGAPNFPYSWPVLKAMINGPYHVQEIVADLGTFTKAEQLQAQKEIGIERAEQNKAADELREKIAGEKDAAKKTQLEDQYKALKSALRKMDSILQITFKDIAISETPASLAGKTKVPTAAEKAEIQKALKPDLKTDSSGKALPFVEKIPGETKTYAEKLRDYMPTMIQSYYDSMVVGKGPAEHTDPTKIHSLKEFEDIGNVSKKETDAVFGKYKTGPPIKADQPKKRGNIHDLWQDTEDNLKKMTIGQRRDMAKTLLFYFFQSDGGVIAMNRAHNADPRFTPTNKPVNDEAKALDKLAEEFTKTDGQVKKLNEIDRGWDATAGGGEINIQIFKQPTADRDRDFLWDMFQTLIHEYLHTLAHTKYNTYAESFGGTQSNQYNALVEGVDSLLDEVVWTNIEPRVNDASLRAQVEGPVYSKLPPIKVLPASRRRYPSYAQAVKLVNIVGIRNLYVAYFLGETDKIGG
jgi:hypothetical protein